MLYYWVKVAHIATVSFTIPFFALRFYWMLRHPHLVQEPLVRYISVCNDILLLAAGITLAVMSHQYPFQAPWLTAKLIGLLIYIVLGALALKRAKSRTMRIYFGILALLCVGYIVSVALSRTPASWILLTG